MTVEINAKNEWARAALASETTFSSDLEGAMPALDTIRLGRINVGGKTQAGLEAVLDEIAETRLQKVSEYGLSRYEETDPKFNQMMCFSDVHRKYIRLRTQALTLVPNTPETREALRETYLDLAAYAAMGVQLIDAEAMKEDTDAED